MMKYIRKGGKKENIKYGMEKEKNFRDNACDEEIHKERRTETKGKKDIRIGRGNMCRKNEMKKYVREEGQKEHK